MSGQEKESVVAEGVVGTQDAAPSDRHWFALYTKPHKEYLVRDRLSGRGVDVYLPEVRVAVRRRDRREMRPFFPHYLFARLDWTEGLMAQLRWTPGLRRIVSADGQPVPVPDEVVAALRRCLADMGEIGPEEPFHRGDLVQMIAGPFEGLEAVFERRLSPQGRVRVFLELMSRWVATDLDIEDLLPAG